MRPVSEQIKEYLVGCIGAVEANRFEEMALWERYHKEKGKTWEGTSGYGVHVGDIDGRPVCLSFLLKTIDGKKILFWHPTSQVVDYVMIEEYMERALPGLPKLSADRFHEFMWDKK